MKEFKRATQNDLLLEFLKYVNENIWVDITKVEVEKYEEGVTPSGMYKSKSMYIGLNSCKYYVNSFYNDFYSETIFNIYDISGKEGIMEKILILSKVL